MYGYNTFHEKLMNNLIKSVRSGSSSHAYIFEGNAGLDILSSAKLFAAALTCAHGDAAPCGSCPSCIQAGADTNPDIIYIEKPKNRQTIGVDPIRAVNDDAAIRPFSSARKVYIVKDGGDLTPAAQNALLKTLEEPPEYVVFIIIVENTAPLLPTVLSRAVLIHFPPVSDDVIEKYVKEKYPDHIGRLQFFKSCCEGVPGVIDSIIADENFEYFRTEALDYLPKLLSSELLDAYSIQSFIEKSKDNAEDIIDFWISYLRDMLAIQLDARHNLINSDKTEELRALSARYSPKLTVKAVNELLTARKMLVRNVNLKALALGTALKIRV